MEWETKIIMIFLLTKYSILKYLNKHIWIHQLDITIIKYHSMLLLDRLIKILQTEICI